MLHKICLLFLFTILYITTVHQDELRIAEQSKVLIVHLKHCLTSEADK